LQPSVSYFGSPVVQRYRHEFAVLKSCWLALSPFDVALRSSLGFSRHEPVDGSLGHPTNLYYFSAKDRFPYQAVPFKVAQSTRTNSSNTPCLATIHPLQHLRPALRPFLALSSVQGKAILLGGSVPRVWLPFPRNSHRVPEEPLSVLNTLGVQLFRAFIRIRRPSRFLGTHHSCTSHENLLASALCFSAFEESSRVPCNLRV
jgi:hypothetical protein